MSPRSENGYTYLKYITDGAYGVVWLAVNEETREEVVIKVMSGSDDNLIEADILGYFDHPNIVKKIDCFRSNYETCLVLEHCGKDLEQILKDEGPMPNTKIAHILRGALSALAYIHDLGFVHYDVKPSNILIDKDSVVKIIDFGLCRHFEEEDSTRAVGTDLYKPAGALLGGMDEYFAFDIWGLGCTLYEMITGHTLFHGGCQLEIIKSIFSILGTPTPETWPEMHTIEYFRVCDPPLYERTLESTLPKDIDPLLVDMLQKMLHYSRFIRSSARELLSHPFLDKF